MVLGFEIKVTLIVDANQPVKTPYFSMGYIDEIAFLAQKRRLTLIRS
jgi:hypothetical protein